MDAAANMIEKAIQANPTYAEAFNNLGLISPLLSLRASLPETTALKLCSFWVLCFVFSYLPGAKYRLVSVIISFKCDSNAGVLYRDAGNITMAIDAYEECLKIDPDSRNAGQVSVL